MRILIVLVLLILGVSAQPVLAGTWNYTYDSQGRLLTVRYSNGTSTTTVTYAYDAAGNRTSVVTQ